MSWRALCLASAGVIAFGACGGGDPPAEGGSGQWLHGRAISVRLTSTAAGDSVEVRNDSDGDFAMAPFMIQLGDRDPIDLTQGTERGAFLGPGESFAFFVTTGDDVDEVHLEIGEGAGRETFTLARSRP